MPWQGITSETLLEASAGAFKQGTIRALNPAEGVNIFFTRTDGSPTENWFVRVYGAKNATTRSTVARRTFRYTSSQLVADFSFSGDTPFYFVEIGNATSGGGSDIVQIVVDHELNGINL